MKHADTMNFFLMHSRTKKYLFRVFLTAVISFLIPLQVAAQTIGASSTASCPEEYLKFTVTGANWATGYDWQTSPDGVGDWTTRGTTSKPSWVGSVINNATTDIFIRAKNHGGVQVTNAIEITQKAAEECTGCQTTTAGDDLFGTDYNPGETYFPDDVEYSDKGNATVLSRDAGWPYSAIPYSDKKDGSTSDNYYYIYPGGATQDVQVTFDKVYLDKYVRFVMRAYYMNTCGQSKFDFKLEGQYGSGAADQNVIIDVYRDADNTLLGTVFTTGSQPTVSLGAYLGTQNILYRFEITVYLGHFTDLNSQKTIMPKFERGCGSNPVAVDFISVETQTICASRNSACAIPKAEAEPVQITATGFPYGVNYKWYRKDKTDGKYYELIEPDEVEYTLVPEEVSAGNTLMTKKIANIKIPSDDIYDYIVVADGNGFTVDPNALKANDVAVKCSLIGADCSDVICPEIETGGQSDTICVPQTGTVNREYTLGDRTGLSSVSEDYEYIWHLVAKDDDTTWDWSTKKGAGDDGYADFQGLLTLNPTNLPAKSGEAGVMLAINKEMFDTIKNKFEGDVNYYIISQVVTKTTPPQPKCADTLQIKINILPDLTNASLSLGAVANNGEICAADVNKDSLIIRINGYDNIKDYKLKWLTNEDITSDPALSAMFGGADKDSLRTVKFINKTPGRQDSALVVSWKKNEACATAADLKYRFILEIDNGGCPVYIEDTFKVKPASKPILTCAAPAAIAAGGNTSQGSWSADEASNSYKIELNSTIHEWEYTPPALTGSTSCGTVPAVVLTVTPAAALKTGTANTYLLQEDTTYTFKYILTDGCGRGDTCSFTIEIEDGNPPNINCDGNGATDLSGASIPNPIKDTTAYLSKSATACQAVPGTGGFTLPADGSFKFPDADDAGNLITGTYAGRFFDENNAYADEDAFKTAFENKSVTLNSSSLADPYKIGATYVVWSFTDAAGNASYCIQTITVIDDKLPVVDCKTTGGVVEIKILPADTINKADKCTLDLNQVLAKLEGKGIKPEVATTYTSCTNPEDEITPKLYYVNGADTLLADGQEFGRNTEYTLVWRFYKEREAGDLYIDSVHYTSCIQKFTVKDSVAPEIKCTSLTDILSTTANCTPVDVHTAYPEISIFSPTDNCTTGAAAFVLSLDSRSDESTNPNAPYPVGTTTITWKVADEAGNFATCTQNVIIKDSTTLTITAVQDTACGSVTLTASGNGISATSVLNWTTDVSAKVTITPDASDTRIVVITPKDPSEPVSGEARVSVNTSGVCYKEATKLFRILTNDISLTLTATNPNAEDKDKNISVYCMAKDDSKGDGTGDQTILLKADVDPTASAQDITGYFWYLGKTPIGTTTENTLTISTGAGSDVSDPSILSSIFREGAKLNFKVRTADGYCFSATSASDTINLSAPGSLKFEVNGAYTVTLYVPESICLDVNSGEEVLNLTATIDPAEAAGNIKEYHWSAWVGGDLLPTDMVTSLPELSIKKGVNDGSWAAVFDAGKTVEFQVVASDNICDPVSSDTSSEIPVSEPFKLEISGGESSLCIPVDEDKNPLSGTNLDDPALELNTNVMQVGGGTSNVDDLLKNNDYKWSVTSGASKQPVVPISTPAGPKWKLTVRDLRDYIGDTLTFNVSVKDSFCTGAIVDTFFTVQIKAGGFSLSLASDLPDKYCIDTTSASTSVTLTATIRPAAAINNLTGGITWYFKDAADSDSIVTLNPTWSNPNPLENEAVTSLTIDKSSPYYDSIFAPGKTVTFEASVFDVSCNGGTLVKESVPVVIDINTPFSLGVTSEQENFCMEDEDSTLDLNLSIDPPAAAKHIEKIFVEVKKSTETDAEYKALSPFLLPPTSLVYRINKSDLQSLYAEINDTLVFRIHAEDTVCYHNDTAKMNPKVYVSDKGIESLNLEVITFNGLDSLCLAGMNPTDTVITLRATDITPASIRPYLTYNWYMTYTKENGDRTDTLLASTAADSLVLTVDSLRKYNANDSLVFRMDAVDDVCGETTPAEGDSGKTIPVFEGDYSFDLNISSANGKDTLCLSDYEAGTDLMTLEIENIDPQFISSYLTFRWTIEDESGNELKDITPADNKAQKVVLEYNDLILYAGRTIKFNVKATDEICGEENQPANITGDSASITFSQGYNVELTVTGGMDAVCLTNNDTLQLKANVTPDDILGNVTILKYTWLYSTDGVNFDNEIGENVIPEINLKDSIALDSTVLRSLGFEAGSTAWFKVIADDSICGPKSDATKTGIRINSRYDIETAILNSDGSEIEKICLEENSTGETGIFLKAKTDPPAAAEHIKDYKWYILGFESDGPLADPTKITKNMSAADGYVFSYELTYEDLAPYVGEKLQFIFVTNDSICDDLNNGNRDTTSTRLEVNERYNLELTSSKEDNPIYCLDKDDEIVLIATSYKMDGLEKITHPAAEKNIKRYVWYVNNIEFGRTLAGVSADPGFDPTIYTINNDTLSNNLVLAPAMAAGSSPVFTVVAYDDICDSVPSADSVTVKVNSNYEIEMSVTDASGEAKEKICLDENTKNEVIVKLEAVTYPRAAANHIEDYQWYIYRDGKSDISLGKGEKVSETGGYVFRRELTYGDLKDYAGQQLKFIFVTNDSICDDLNNGNRDTTSTWFEVNEGGYQVEIVVADNKDAICLSNAESIVLSAVITAPSKSNVKTYEWQYSKDNKQTFSPIGVTRDTFKVVDTLLLKGLGVGAGDSLYFRVIAADSICDSVPSDPTGLIKINSDYKIITSVTDASGEAKEKICLSESTKDDVIVKLEAVTDPRAAANHIEDYQWYIYRDGESDISLGKGEKVSETNGYVFRRELTYADLKDYTGQQLKFIFVANDSICDDLNNGNRDTTSTWLEVNEGYDLELTSSKEDNPIYCLDKDDEIVLIATPYKMDGLEKITHPATEKNIKRYVWYVNNIEFGHTLAGVNADPGFDPTIYTINNDTLNNNTVLASAMAVGSSPVFKVVAQDSICDDVWSKDSVTVRVNSDYEIETSVTDKNGETVDPKVCLDESMTDGTGIFLRAVTDPSAAANHITKYGWYVRVVGSTGDSTLIGTGEKRMENGFYVFLKELTYADLEKYVGKKLQFSFVTNDSICDNSDRSAPVQSVFEVGKKDGYELELTSSKTDPVYCLTGDDEITLTAEVLPAGNPAKDNIKRYVWYVNEVEFAGTTVNTYTINKDTLAGNTVLASAMAVGSSPVFKVVAQDSICDDVWSKDSVTVRVNSDYEIETSVTDKNGETVDPKVCLDESMTDGTGIFLRAVTDPSAAANHITKYGWYVRVVGSTGDSTLIGTGEKRMENGFYVFLKELTYADLEKYVGKKLQFSFVTNDSICDDSDRSAPVQSVFEVGKKDGYELELTSSKTDPVYCLTGDDEITLTAEVLPAGNPAKDNIKRYVWYVNEVEFAGTTVNTYTINKDTLAGNTVLASAMAVGSSPVFKVVAQDSICDDVWSKDSVTVRVNSDYEIETSVTDKNGETVDPKVCLDESMTDGTGIFLRAVTDPSAAANHITKYGWYVRVVGSTGDSTLIGTGEKRMENGFYVFLKELTYADLEKYVGKKLQFSFVTNDSICDDSDRSAPVQSVFEVGKKDGYELELTSSKTDPVYCLTGDDEITLTAEVLPAGNPAKDNIKRYVWYVNEVEFAGTTVNTYTINKDTLAGNTVLASAMAVGSSPVFKVVAQDSICDDVWSKDSVTVRVNSDYEIETSITDKNGETVDPKVCLDESMTDGTGIFLRAVTDPSAAANHITKYGWYVRVVGSTGDSTLIGTGEKRMENGSYVFLKELTYADLEKYVGKKLQFSFVTNDSICDNSDRSAPVQSVFEVGKKDGYELELTSSKTDPVYCLTGDDEITLTAEVLPAGNPAKDNIKRYVWYVNEVEFAGTTVNTYTINKDTLAGNTVLASAMTVGSSPVFKVVAQDSICDDVWSKDSVTVRVNSDYEIETSITDKNGETVDPKVCLDESMTDGTGIFLRAVTDPSAAANHITKYGWYVRVVGSTGDSTLIGTGEKRMENGSYVFLKELTYADLEKYVGKKLQFSFVTNDSICDNSDRSAPVQSVFEVGKKDGYELELTSSKTDPVYCLTGDDEITLTAEVLPAGNPAKDNIKNYIWFVNGNKFGQTAIGAYTINGDTLKNNAVLNAAMITGSSPKFTVTAHDGICDDISSKDTITIRVNESYKLKLAITNGDTAAICLSAGAIMPTLTATTDPSGADRQITAYKWFIDKEVSPGVKDTLNGGKATTVNKYTLTEAELKAYIGQQIIFGVWVDDDICAKDSVIGRTTAPFKVNGGYDLELTSSKTDPVYCLTGNDAITLTANVLRIKDAGGNLVDNPAKDNIKSYIWYVNGNLFGQTAIGAYTINGDTLKNNAVLNAAMITGSSPKFAVTAYDGICSDVPAKDTITIEVNVKYQLNLAVDNKTGNGGAVCLGDLDDAQKSSDAAIVLTATADSVAAANHIKQYIWEVSVNGGAAQALDTTGKGENIYKLTYADLTNYIGKKLTFSVKSTDGICVTDATGDWGAGKSDSTFYVSYKYKLDLNVALIDDPNATAICVDKIVPIDVTDTIPDSVVRIRLTATPMPDPAAAAQIKQYRWFVSANGSAKVELEVRDITKNTYDVTNGQLKEYIGKKLVFSVESEDGICGKGEGTGNKDITIGKKLDALISGNSSNVCLEGGKLILTAKIIPEEEQSFVTSYQWYAYETETNKSISLGTTTTAESGNVISKIPGAGKYRFNVRMTDGICDFGTADDMSSLSDTALTADDMPGVDGLWISLEDGIAPRDGNKVCRGTEVVLSASLTGGPTQIEWDDLQGRRVRLDSTSATKDILDSTIVLLAEEAQGMKVRVYNKGCGWQNNSLSIDLDIYDPIELSARALRPEICLNDTVFVEVTLEKGRPVRYDLYAFSSGNGNNAEHVDSLKWPQPITVIDTMQHNKPDVSGLWNYYVIASDNVCDERGPFYIENPDAVKVREPISVELLADNAEVVIGGSVNLTANVLTGEPDKFVWRRNDTYLDTPLYNEDEYELYPKSSAKYYVEASDKYCEDAVASIDIKVKLPTVITPGDGNDLNSVFMKDFAVEIFNRYGQKVFSGPHGWDGSYRGKEAEPGVYFYSVVLEDGKTAKGSVELMKFK